MGFERWTERARQVIVLSQEEARTLKHNFIGTEHILLGLLREEEGVAARVLESMDITAERTRLAVLGLSPVGEEAIAGQIPFTPRSQKVCELALREALGLGHNYIGTEHVLLGLVRENEGVAARILLNFDADSEKIRNEVVRMLSGPGARRASVPKVETITLDDQQAASMFRLHVNKPLLGCQFEQGRMRWWLAQGLLLELTQDRKWLLSVVPTRGLAQAA